MSNFPHNPNGLVTFAQIRQLIPISHHGMTNEIEKGRFPKPVIKGVKGSRSFWRAIEIQRLIETGDWRPALTTETA